MIVYSTNKKTFMDGVLNNVVHQKILNEFQVRLGRRVADNEIDAWRNSLQYMRNVLDDDAIPENAGVAIEFNIPLTNKRIDFILTGKNEQRQDAAVIIELKQWTQVHTTEKDAIVRTHLGGGERETYHPSYQAWLALL